MHSLPGFSGHTQLSNAWSLPILRDIHFTTVGSLLILYYRDVTYTSWEIFCLLLAREEEIKDSEMRTFDQENIATLFH